MRRVTIHNAQGEMVREVKHIRSGSAKQIVVWEPGDHPSVRVKSIRLNNPYREFKCDYLLEKGDSLSVYINITFDGESPSPVYEMWT